MGDSGHPVARRAVFAEVTGERPARRAEFADVSPDRKVKKPRWLSPRESTVPPPPRPASQPPTNAGNARPGATPSLKPAPVPKEFVQAVRRELRTVPNAPAAHAASHEVARDLAESEALAAQMARSLRPSELPPSFAVPPHAAEPKAPDPGLERAFRTAVEEMAKARAQVLEAAAGQLASLAAIIARRVIARELALAPEILEDLVREALEALSDQDRIRVRVGRGFQNAVDGLERQLALRGHEFRIFVEDGLADYDCVVETELGQVDESVEKRLEKLLAALKPDSEAP
ncbi:MAG TPA: FliH/SctL family protein [Polyangiaceae bacterium]|nr:FliH/SctL family protein [Polyangiaceae bacterium]